MGEAIYDGSESIITKAMLIPYKDYPDVNETSQKLLAALRGEDTPQLHTKARYWHGYLTVVKPLLLITSYQNIRILNLIIEAVLAWMLSLLLFRKIGWGASASWLITWLFINPVSASFCMEYAIMYYISTIATILLLSGFVSNKNLPYYFLLIGIVTAFFDFLTYPLLGLILPLTVWLLLEIHHSQAWPKNCLIYSFFWLLGYAGMWAEKWILSTILTDQNVIADAISTIRFRSSRTAYDQRISYWEVIEKNLNVLGNIPLVLFSAFVIVGFVIIFIRYYKKQIRKNELLTFLLLTVSPFIWYFVLQNHSAIHYWFTYRTLSAFIIPFFNCVLLPLNEHRKDG
ncbi:MAG: hypothetical protein K5696_01225 [Lachnospiraceae bacterium]|nr:hypothetical protein [Lachnospiraceae bacterium]